MTDDTLPIKVGELKGRMDSMEARVDRHEDFVGENFRVIRESMTSIDTKLDAIREQNAKGAGGLGAFRWLATIGIGAYGWAEWLWWKH